MRRTPIVFASLMMLVMAGAPAVADTATPGSLDTTFSIGAGPTSPTPPSAVQAIAVQPDGKVVVGGFFTKFNGLAVNGITRLTADGALDPSFNVGTGTVKGSVATVALQPDGKVLVGGFMTEFNGTPAHGIVRLNANGTVDNTFVQGTGFNDQVFDIEVQTDGKIMVAGAFTTYDGTPSPDVVRLLPTGAIDPTFASGRGVDAATGIDRILVQADGKYMFFGSLRSYGDATVNGIVRVNADGTRDTTFNPGEGVGPNITDAVYSVIPQGDKYIVGGAFRTFNGQPRANLVRLTSTGAVDTTFGTANTSPNYQVNQVIAQANGKLIAVGNFDKVGTKTNNGIVRLTKDAKIDPTFVSGTGFPAAVSSEALQGDSKLLVGGFFSKYNSVAVNQLVRLDASSLATGTLLPQTGTLDLPAKVLKKGKTVLLKKAVVTNADQKASSKVTWSTKKSAKGTSSKYATVKTSAAGKVTITTKGAVKKLYVKLTVNAPADEFYSAYSATKKWTVK